MMALVVKGRCCEVRAGARDVWAQKEGRAGVCCCETRGEILLLILTMRTLLYGLCGITSHPLL